MSGSAKPCSLKGEKSYRDITRVLGPSKRGEEEYCTSNPFHGPLNLISKQLHFRVAGGADRMDESWLNVQIRLKAGKTGSQSETTRRRHTVTMAAKTRRSFALYFFKARPQLLMFLA